MPPVSCGTESPCWMINIYRLSAECPTWIQRSLNACSYLPNGWSMVISNFIWLMFKFEISQSVCVCVCCRWSPQIVVSYIHLPAQPDTCHPSSLILDSNRTWLTAWIESVYWWLLMYIVKDWCLCHQSKLLIAALPTPSCRLNPPVAIPESPSHRIIWTSRSTWITSLLGAVLDLISLTSTILWC